MDFKDYYKILGVSKTATEAEIKSAYRKLARKYHPDSNKGDKEKEQKFKEVSEAYEVLKDTEKRSKYDNLGSSWRNYSNSGGKAQDFNWNNWYSGGQGSSGGFGDMFGGQGGGLSDFFQKIFGGGGSSGFSGFTGSQGFGRSQKGQDYKSEVSLTLEEAYSGTSRLIKVSDESININFKKGISNGQILKLSGKGMPSQNGGPNGNLLIEVKIADHKTFKRKGNDLYMDVFVDIFTAVLGGKVKVNTLKGPIDLNIPAGTDSGKLLKLSGLGMPSYSNSGHFGNLYVKIMIKSFKNLSVEEKKLFEKLKGIRS